MTSTASLRAMDTTCGFASANFAKRAVAQSLAREYGKLGVHVFHAVIDGVVDRPQEARSYMPGKPDGSSSSRRM